jgi:hypothetical protein
VTACGGGEDETATQQPEPTDSLVTQKPPATPTAKASMPRTTPTPKPTRRVPMTRCNAAQVVAGLKGAGYSCGTEFAYAICRSAPVEVWLLTGEHPRPPVISVQVAGAVAPARKAIGARLVEVLQAAHVNEGPQVAAWYRGQQNRTDAAKRIGDWQVELSAEQESDAPGVHLTLNDKLCKRACQAE